MTAADGHLTQRVGHLGVDDAPNAGGGFLRRHSKRNRDLLPDHLCRTRVIELHFSAEESIGIDDAKHDVSVRHRCSLAPAPITNGAGPDACAVWTDPELSVDDASNRAAPGADRADVDHRRRDMEAAGFMIGRHKWLVVNRDRHIEGRAAHIGRDDVLVSHALGEVDRPHDASGRSGGD